MIMKPSLCLCLSTAVKPFYCKDDFNYFKMRKYLVKLTIQTASSFFNSRFGAFCLNQLDNYVLCSSLYFCTKFDTWFMRLQTKHLTSVFNQGSCQLVGVGVGESYSCRPLKAIINLVLQVIGILNN